MPKLYLHIGHPKTGTSAMQVSFARSTQSLRQQNISYPEHRSTDLALAGRFTAGNVTRTQLFDSYQEHRAVIGDEMAILYSCEGLFDDLDEQNSQVAQLAHSGVEIELLMFLRNPVEFALSFYQQKIKGTGYSGSTEDYLASFDQLEQVSRVLDRIKTLGLPLTLHSFDRSQSKLLDLAETWLGLQRNTLERTGHAPTNRSATRAEQAFLRSLSAHLGISGTDHIGHALANTLPDVPKELPILSRAGYDAFVARTAPQVARLNARLPEAVQYRLTPYDQLYEAEPVVDQFTFSQAQIDVITKALASRAPDADFARELIKWIKTISEGDMLSAEDILRLNRLGQVLRPGNFPEQRMKRLQMRADKLNSEHGDSTG